VLPAAFGVPAYLHGGAVLCLLLLTAAYVPVTLALAYCLAFLFKTVEAGGSFLYNIFFFVST
jgi:hypothetical protein